MKFICDGMHGAEYGERLYRARFDGSALGDDGTGTMQIVVTQGGGESVVAGGRAPSPTRHACTPAVSPNGRHVIVSVEMATTAPGLPASVHAKRHGGTGVYTDLYRMSPDGRKWTQLTAYAPKVTTSWFPNTPAGALIPQWISNNQVIWTQMIGYSAQLVLGVREVVVADFVDGGGPPLLENHRTYRPGWAEGARFYEVWGIENGVALVCSDLGRSSHAFPGVFLWEIGSDELVPLSAGNPNDWEEQAFFVNGRIFFMTTAGLDYQPSGGKFWRTLQTEVWVMDMDGSHRERVTFIHEPDHPNYIARADNEAVRAIPFSRTRHGLYLDVVRNTFDGVQLHGAAQIWHLCV